MQVITTLIEIVDGFTQHLNFDLLHSILLSFFLSFILSEKLGITYYFKKIFRIKQTKKITLLDCYPCFSFWFALLFSLNLYVAIIVYFIAYKIDKDGE